MASYLAEFVAWDLTCCPDFARCTLDWWGKYTSSWCKLLGSTHLSRVATCGLWKQCKCRRRKEAILQWTGQNYGQAEPSQDPSSCCGHSVCLWLDWRFLSSRLSDNLFPCALGSAGDSGIREKKAPHNGLMTGFRISTGNNAKMRETVALSTSKHAHTSPALFSSLLWGALDLRVTKLYF